MSDDPLPKPEPKEIDEKNAMLLKHMVEDNVLKGVPYGDERCDNCLYYLNPDENISYCWHPKLRILVGGPWWCQWWEAIPEDIRPSKDQPFYHLLAENEQNTYVAYVSEQNLLADETGEPVAHPQTQVIFESFDHGAYKLRPRISH